MSKRTKPLKLGVLASGSGTNLQAIIDACEGNLIGARVAVVISDVAEAQALERARRHDIPAIHVHRDDFPAKKEFERAILTALNDHGVELVCLAGYMRIVGPTLLKPFYNRMINIHPALLPAFPGLEAQRQAWEYGVKVAGCTVHFVDELTDHGPIIAQACVEVKEDDTPEDLRLRILAEEHRVYPQVIGWIADGKVAIDGRRVTISAR